MTRLHICPSNDFSISMYKGEILMMYCTSAAYSKTVATPPTRGHWTVTPDTADTRGHHYQSVDTRGLHYQSQHKKHQLENLSINLSLSVQFCSNIHIGSNDISNWICLNVDESQCPLWKNHFPVAVKGLWTVASLWHELLSCTFFWKHTWKKLNLSNLELAYTLYFNPKS